MLFTKEVEGEPSFLLFLVQQFFAPICGLVALLFCALVLRAIPWSAHFAGANIFVPALTLMSSLAGGAGGGWLITGVVEKATSSARLVWIIPCVLLLLVVLDSVFNKTVYSTIRDLIFPFDGPESWWAFVFFTCPTAACLGYSLSASAKSRKSVPSVPGCKDR